MIPTAKSPITYAPLWPQGTTRPEHDGCAQVTRFFRFQGCAVTGGEHPPPCEASSQAGPPSVRTCSEHFPLLRSTARTPFEANAFTAIEPKRGMLLPRPPRESPSIAECRCDFNQVLGFCKPVKCLSLRQLWLFRRLDIRSFGANSAFDGQRAFRALKLPCQDRRKRRDDPRLASPFASKCWLTGPTPMAPESIAKFSMPSAYQRHADRVLCGRRPNREVRFFA